MRPADVGQADLLTPDPIGPPLRRGAIERAAASRSDAAGATVCEMPVRRCGAAAVLLEGGPVRVPFRPCCAVALVQGLCGASREAPERRE